MTKLILIVILALSLQAEECWNLETEDWIQFNWKETCHIGTNATDIDGEPIDVYYLYDGNYACYYTRDKY